MINRNNYEQYFIDHLDGQLDAAMVVELNLFLENHPDLKEELVSFEAININLQDSYNFPEKEKLKKDVIVSNGLINDNNYNHYFIAFLEGDLSIEGIEEVKSFLELNPQLQAELDLFDTSHLSANESIVFTDKKSLKKNPFLLFKTWYKPIGIAASIVLLFGIFNILQPISIFSPPVERTEVPLKMNGKEAQIFELSFNDYIPSTRKYQIIITQTKELIPIEPLFAMESIKIPLKSIIASLAYPVANVEILAFRNEYDVIVKELMINEELLLASYGESNPNSRVRIEKALWAKSFGKQKRRKSREEKIGDENKKARVNLWTLASIGIESFNEITGSNINIERKLNKEGEKNKYILVNGNLNTSEVTDVEDKPNL